MSNLFFDKDTYIEREAKRKHEEDPRFTVEDWKKDIKARATQREQLEKEIERQNKRKDD